MSSSLRHWLKLWTVISWKIVSEKDITVPYLTGEGFHTKNWCQTSRLTDVRIVSSKNISLEISSSIILQLDVVSIGLWTHRLIIPTSILYSYHRLYLSDVFCSNTTIWINLRTLWFLPNNSATSFIFYVNIFQLSLACYR